MENKRNQNRAVSKGATRKATVNKVAQNLKKIDKVVPYEMQRFETLEKNAQKMRACGHGDLAAAILQKHNATIARSMLEKDLLSDSDDDIYTDKSGHSGDEDFQACETKGKSNHKQNKKSSKESLSQLEKGSAAFQITMTKGGQRKLTSRSRKNHFVLLDPWAAINCFDRNNKQGNSLLIIMNSWTTNKQ